MLGLLRYVNVKRYVMMPKVKICDAICLEDDEGRCVTGSRYYQLHHMAVLMAT